jgi:hypothetical protein
VPLTSDSGLRKPFQESNSAERATQKKKCSRLGGRRAPTAEPLEVVIRESIQGDAVPIVVIEDHPVRNEYRGDVEGANGSGTGATRDRLHPRDSNYCLGVTT